jgi:aminoethylphosphonate catabolism LysR family transcriptional regulator
MRYFQLRAFDAVAREQGFSRAAAELKLTQPAVTTQVRNLEIDCGQSLFDRSGAAVRLTDAGRALFALTRQMFQVVDDIDAFVASAGQLGRGTLRLTMDNPQAAFRVIEQFQKTYPGIMLTLTTGNQREVLSRIFDHQADLAIVGNATDDPRLMRLDLGIQRLMMLVPRGHAFSRCVSVPLQALGDHTVIKREASSNTQRTADAALRERKIFPHTGLSIDSREGLQQAVALNLGVGFVFEDEWLGDPRTVLVPLDDLPLTNVDSLVCLQSQRKHAIVQAFIDIARTVSRPLP